MEQKKINFDIMDYNHKIYDSVSKMCKNCKKDAENSHCIVCSKHLDLLLMCYSCGDVVCGKCCPISASSHNSKAYIKGEYETKKEKK